MTENTAVDTGNTGDVVQFLLSQHQQIRTLLDSVLSAGGQARQGAFDDARELLARHQTAEKMAPTHPHPSAKTTAMNYVAGPFAAMLDRARDAFSKSGS